MIVAFCSHSDMSDAVTQDKTTRDYIYAGLIQGDGENCILTSHWRSYVYDTRELTILPRAASLSSDVLTSGHCSLTGIYT
jgi:hypothetical protein